MLTLVLSDCLEKQITELGELCRDSLGLTTPRKLEFVNRTIPAGLIFLDG